MHLKPKKSLGQNFLVDKNIRNKIISACGFGNSDVILEIGAGRGQMTRLIAERAALVYALEIDPQLCQMLKDSTQDIRNLKIVNEDILKFNLTAYFAKMTQKIKVFGNIPYYISSGIIAHLIKHRNIIEEVFLTVQKEFAQRACAKPGSKDYGSFSCFVQYYACAKILFPIKNTSFLPKPKVDSSFLRLNLMAEPKIKVSDEEFFFKLIRAAFNKRRKTLRNSLKDIIRPEKLSGFLRGQGINRDIRPERLSLDDFADLTNYLKN
jgi:16S rRNA (adenine1518-N6/adenine1519-N6)-dimethyltransferase